MTFLIMFLFILIGLGSLMLFITAVLAILHGFKLYRLNINYKWLLVISLLLIVLPMLIIILLSYML